MAGGLDVPVYLGSRATFPGGNFGGYQGRYLQVRARHNTDLCNCAIHCVIMYLVLSVHFQDTVAKVTVANRQLLTVELIVFVLRCANQSTDSGLRCLTTRQTVLTLLTPCAPPSNPPGGRHPAPRQARGRGQTH